MTSGAPLFRFDRKLIKLLEKPPRSFCLVGIDEAGRGPLAGPVVASAVVLPRDFYDARLNDSKKLKASLRLNLYKKLRTKARWAIGTGQVSLIDSVNILKATHMAMKGALANLLRRYPGLKPDLIIIDGLPVPGMGFPQKSIVEGDGKSASIAAASVIAKVFRDRIMTTLSKSYPAYGLHKHKGYGTPQHQKNLLRFGPSPVHRRSFSPVKALLEKVPE